MYLKLDIYNLDIKKSKKDEPSNVPEEFMKLLKEMFPPAPSNEKGKKEINSNKKRK